MWTTSLSDQPHFPSHLAAMQGYGHRAPGAVAQPAGASLEPDDPGGMMTQQHGKAWEDEALQRLTVGARAAALGLTGYFTLLLGGVFLLVAVSSTGTPLPWDWSRMDWGVAASRYQACTERRGGDVLSCMLGSGPQSASSARVSSDRAAASCSVTVVQHAQSTAHLSAKPVARPTASPAGRSASTRV